MITDGVIPSLHVDYKGTRIKQYHKEGRALRTETTINNTRDFYIGKSLRNLPALRQIGFQANRRLLQVEKISHDCLLSEEVFQKLNRPHSDPVPTGFRSPLRRSPSAGLMERAVVVSASPNRLLESQPPREPSASTRPIIG